MSKVLFIAYHFPPDAAVGALRPQKFVKYLKEFGWEPHVVTIRERYIEKCDESRLADIANANIVRTPFLRTPLQLMIDIRDKVRGYQSEAKQKRVSPSTQGVFQIKRETILSRLKRYFVALNWFPDDKLWWSIPAVFAGLLIIRREKIPIIYATSPPPTVIIIGYLLSLLTGAKLILDLRDPWVVAKDEVSPEEMGWARIKVWKRSLERFAIQRAEFVICTTDRFRRVLISHYNNIPPGKFLVIPNGYDAEDLIPGSDVLYSSKYIVSYLGTFYKDRSPKNFFIALQKLIQQGVISVDDIEIHLIGYVKYAGGESVKEMVEDNGLVDVVKFMDLVPHREAMRLMANSNLLLLLAPNQPYQIPGKVYEYIGARRPILALTDEGATADLVRTLNAGMVVSQGDISGIAGALATFYADRLHPSSRWYNDIDTALFERRNLTAQLAQCLDVAARSQLSRQR